MIKYSIVSYSIGTRRRAERTRKEDKARPKTQEEKEVDPRWPDRSVAEKLSPRCVTVRENRADARGPFLRRRLPRAYPLAPRNCAAACR